MSPPDPKSELEHAIWRVLEREVLRAVRKSLFSDLLQRFRAVQLMTGPLGMSGIGSRYLLAEFRGDRLAQLGKVTARRYNTANPYSINPI